MTANTLQHFGKPFAQSKLDECKSFVELQGNYEPGEIVKTSIHELDQVECSSRIIEKANPKELADLKKRIQAAKGMPLCFRKVVQGS